MKFSRKRKGFGLLEILISSIIMVLVLAEMLGSFTSGRYFSRRARDRLVALNFARERMEELLYSGYSGLLAFPTGVEIIDPSVLPPLHEFIQRTNARRYLKIEDFYDFNTDPLRPAYKKVSVIIKWQFLSSIYYRQSLSSLMFNPDFNQP